MSDILVFAELHENEVTDMSLQCLAMARKLDSKVTAVAIGSNLDNVTATLASHGADTVALATHQDLNCYLARPFKKVLTELNTKLSPKLVLFPASTQGNDLASVFATTISSACLLNTKEITLEGDKLSATKVEFDGKVLTTYGTEKTLVASIKDGAIDALPEDTSKNAETITLDVTLDEIDLTSKVINRELAKKTVNLKAAKVIIAAGAGIGSKEGYTLVEKLADALSGEVGATRPVVDAGWATADRQIGQTGATVKPDLYIACGVSGAVQHMVGLTDAKTVIAINTDQNAPIFKFANYCINGDIKEVIPKLIDAIQ